MMIPSVGGELSEPFKLAVKETELHQRIGVSEFVASCYGWGTFDGTHRCDVVRGCAPVPNVFYCRSLSPRYLSVGIDGVLYRGITCVIY